MNSNQIVEQYLSDNGFEPLKNYEIKYMINNQGQIWSIRSKRLLEGSIDKNGDSIVQLPVEKKYKNFKIQDLIDIQYNNKNNKFFHHIDLSEFEPLKDFENWYLINRNGQLWSLCYNKLLKIQINDDGYKIVTLTNDIKNNNKRFIHRLLAIQYISNPDNLPEVDHIDRDKTNNNLDNLRWVTYSHNCRNKDRCYNHQGTICECYDKNRNKKYYKAHYNIDYSKKKQKSSDDRKVCEDWLIEMREKYPRDNKI
jgi:hypothetical protein